MVENPSKTVSLKNVYVLCRVFGIFGLILTSFSKNCSLRSGSVTKQVNYYLIGQKFIEIAKIINFDEKYFEMRLFLVIFKDDVYSSYLLLAKTKNFIFDQKTLSWLSKL